jgi:thiol:disulfide interchange protein
VEEESKPSFAWHFVRSVLITVVVILVVVGLICWVVGWTTADQFGRATIVGGLISIVFGLFSVAGEMGMTRSYTYQAAESAGEDTLYDRTRESQRNLVDTMQALIILGSAGVVAIVIGLLIRAIAG